MPPSQPDIDRAFAEIDAMRAVANALGSLRDADSRSRVLAWARDHFTPAVEEKGTLRITDGSTANVTPHLGDSSALALGEDIFAFGHDHEIRRPVPFVPVDHGTRPRAESWRRPAASRFKFERQLRVVARAFRRLTHKSQRAS
jgi:hypothetical protein